MTTTPNLAIPLIDAAQTQKETAANAAFAALENAITESLSVEASDTPVSLAAADVQAAAHVLITNAGSPAATGAHSAILPATKHLLFISNDSGYAASISCAGDGSPAAEVSIPDAERRLVYCDGTTVYAVGDAPGALVGDQAANVVHAGPTTGAAAPPTYRALVADDLPAQPFDVGAFYPGVPTDAAVMLRVPVARAITIPADFAGSYGTASAASTGTVEFDIQKNGTTIGTATFTAAATATFTTVGSPAAEQTLAAGDVLSIVCPGTADATLADIGFVLVGSR